MAHEMSVRPYRDPIDREALAVTPLEEEANPVTSMTIDGVRVQFPSSDAEDREYEVEVEYRPEEWGLEDWSFARYLMTFDEARLTQEMITQQIRRDLRAALDVDDVFVMVHREFPAEKRTMIGEV